MADYKGIAMLATGKLGIPSTANATTFAKLKVTTGPFDATGDITVTGSVDGVADLGGSAIASTDGSLTTSGTLAGANLVVETVFSTTGTVNRSIDASDLASVSNGLGASLIGIEDPGTKITATDVEGAVVEIATDVDVIEAEGISGGSGITASGTIGGGDLSVAIGTLTADWNTGTSFKITGLKPPTGASDAARKADVDAARAGLDIKDSVDVATVEILDDDADITGAPTYNPIGGTSTRGQITATLAVSGTFGIDGEDLVNNDRMLIKDEGSGTVEVHSVDTVANVTSGLNNDYFVLYETPNQAYYIWFDCASAGTDPNPTPPSGVTFTGIEVDLGTDDSADAVATAVKTALDASNYAGTTARTTNALTMTNTHGGNVTDVAEGVGTGFTFGTDTQGTGMGPAANGLWKVTISGTSLTLDRTIDFDEDAEVTAGAYTFVEKGTTHANSGWVVITDDPIIIGGAAGVALYLTQSSGAGQIDAGTGMAKDGNTLNVGAGEGIIANVDDLDVDEAYAFQWTGDQDVVSGEIDFAAGTFKLAGTAVAATATQVDYCVVPTPGTAVASKALVYGASKNIDTIDVTKDGFKIGGSAVLLTATEANQLDGTTNIAEADTFFGATDMTGAEAEELTDGSTTTKHEHALATGANDVTTTAAELNQFEGISANVTDTSLNVLTAGSTSDADSYHTHSTLQEGVITTTGDIIRGDGTGDPERYAIGTTGHVLTVVGGTPTWAAAAAGTLAALTDTNITTPADAALLLYDDGTSTWRDATMSGDASINDTGALTLGGNVVDSDHLDETDDYTLSGTINLSGTWQVGGTSVTATAALLNEAGTFFGATDMTGVEAEELSSAGECDLHIHDLMYYTESEIDTFLAAQDTLAEMDDVVITGPVDDDLLQYDNATSKWVDRSPAEAGLPEIAGNNTYSGNNDFTAETTIDTLFLDGAVMGPQIGATVGTGGQAAGNAMKLDGSGQYVKRDNPDDKFFAIATSTTTATNPGWACPWGIVEVTWETGKAPTSYGQNVFLCDNPGDEFKWTTDPPDDGNIYRATAYTTGASGKILLSPGMLGQYE